MRLRSLEDCVRVGEAAKILGVTTKTLRNWDRAGKVRAQRHPVNGYRIYSRAELEDLLNSQRKAAANDRFRVQQTGAESAHDRDAPLPDQHAH